MNVKSVLKDNLFKGKVAIVTGGATGIGAAITAELAHLGCDVMIASRNEEKLKNASENLNAENSIEGKVAWTKCNIRKEEDVRSLMEHTIKKFGKINFLVNNGGGQFRSTADKISAKGWNAVVDTNLNGTFYCCKYVYLMWMKEHGGVIVNMLADMWRGFPYMSHTGAARSAVDNLTKSLAIEWAPDGIRVNAIAPGTIFSQTAKANYGENNDLFELSTQIQPFGRNGCPEEILGVVAFMLSPAASFMSGESIRIDGASSLCGPVFTKSEPEKHPQWNWSNSKL